MTSLPAMRVAMVLVLAGAGHAATGAEPEPPPVTLQSAVSAAVESNYGIRVQKIGVDAGEGRLTTASGDFDWNLVSDLSASRDYEPDLLPYAVGTDLSGWNYSAGVQRKLRNGVVISPTLGADALKDRDETTDRWVSRGSINFEITLPLARGGGTVSAAAGENFARKDLDSSYANYRHQVASSVLDTVSAYWNCVGATGTVAILQRWEQEAGELEATVTRLAKANLFSPAYIEQAQSYSREKKTRRINAELEEYKARQTLGVAMGMKDIDLSVPPMPADPFPTLSAPALPPSSDYAQVIHYALAHRQDLAALQSTQEALAYLSRAARHDLRPRVDLSLHMSYDGVDRGQRPQSPFDNLHDGLRVIGGLSMEFPLENRVYSGQLRERLAEEEQASVLRDQLSQSISSDVMVALKEVASTFNAYSVSLDAEKYYQQALDKERKRFLLGDASFVDVITIQDNYRDTQLETITARQAHLVALARLRYATGTLVQGADAGGTVSVEEMSKVPDFR